MFSSRFYCHPGARPQVGSPGPMNAGLWNSVPGSPLCLAAPGMTIEDHEFGPRSIDTGCQRRRSVLVSTDGLTQDIGHLPLRTSDNSRPTRRRRAGSNRAEAEATCAVRITLSILRSG